MNDRKLKFYTEGQIRGAYFLYYNTEGPILPVGSQIS